MTEDHIEDRIRTENAETHSTDDQISISHWLWDEGITPLEEGLKRTEIEDELEDDLDYNVKTSLGHLENIGLVEEYREPGVETFAIADWKDNGVVNGSVDEAAEEGIEALIDHMQDDDVADDGESAIADGARPTIRSVVAERFDIIADAVESHLRDADDQVDRLNDAVDAIEEHNEVDTRDDYGEIYFVNRAFRYRLTERAVGLYER